MKPDVRLLRSGEDPLAGRAGPPMHLPDEVPEEDGYEQAQSALPTDDGYEFEGDLPDEADPADAREQRMSVPDPDEGDER
jgi:hypothetical protein